MEHRFTFPLLFSMKTCGPSKIVSVERPCGKIFTRCCTCFFDEARFDESSKRASVPSSSSPEALESGYVFIKALHWRKAVPGSIDALHLLECTDDGFVEDIVDGVAVIV